MADCRRRVRFGVNYTPSKKWYYIWNDWDRREVEEDFDAIASIGADHVRVQLIWPSFQPNPTYVSPGHLRRLGELMDIAAERSIDGPPISMFSTACSSVTSSRDTVSSNG